MSGFERMNTEEREPFDHYVVRQQNKALRAAVSQKRRRIHELSRSLAERQREARAATALVSCAERHWRQLEADARLLLGLPPAAPAEASAAAASENGGGSKGDGSSSSSSVLEALLLRGADRYLRADLTKVAEAAAASEAAEDTLDEVIKYDDEDGEGWLAGFLGEADGESDEDSKGGGGGGGSKKKKKKDKAKREEEEGEEGEGGDGEDLAAVEAAVRRQCAGARQILEQLAAKLQQQLPTVGGARSSGSEAAAAGEGASPPGNGGALSVTGLVAGNQRLQAQVELMRDRLAQARRTQANLYKGLIRALKDRHRLLRPMDWGLAGPPGGAGGVKMEVDGGGHGHGHEGTNGVLAPGEGGGSCHGEHKSCAGHKRKRSMGPGGEDEAGEAGAGAGGASAAELAAATERAEEQAALAAARLEELERLQKDKAALERRVTALVASEERGGGHASSSSSSSRSASPAGMVGEGQYRRLAAEVDAAVAEKAAAERRAQALAKEVAALKGKVALLARAKQEAVEAERTHLVARAEEAAREVAALRRQGDALALEAEAHRELVRQAEELKAALAEERAEAERQRAMGQKQASELKELRSQCAALQDRLAAREREVDALGRQTLAPLAPDAARDARIASLEAQLAEHKGEGQRLREFQSSLFEETESLNSAYEELQKTSRRLREQVEEKEKRNARLQDDVMRTKAAEKVQLERAAAIERRAAALDGLRRQQEEALRQLQEQAARVTDRCHQLQQEQSLAEERRQEEVRALHAAERAQLAAEGKLATAEGQAKALAKRAEELGAALEAAEAERAKLREQLAAAERSAKRAQKQASSAAAAASASAGSASASAGSQAVGVNEAMRKLLNCSVCNVRFKDTLITKCYHMFCRECVDDNLKVRSRKCPACGKGYSQQDVKPVFLT